jgi:hypothetical protein
VPIVLKSGSLNLLEPSGPVKGRNGIALPLPLQLKYKHVMYAAKHNISTPHNNSLHVAINQNRHWVPLLQNFKKKLNTFAIRKFFVSKIHY